MLEKLYAVKGLYSTCGCDRGGAHTCQAVFGSEHSPRTKLQLANTGDAIFGDGLVAFADGSVLYPYEPITVTGPCVIGAVFGDERGLQLVAGERAHVYQARPGGYASSQLGILRVERL